MTFDMDPARTFFSHRVVRQGTIDRLLTAGVPPLALAQPDVLVTASVIFDGHLFSFAEEAGEGGDCATAILVLIRDDTGVPLDIAAWRGEQIASWLGCAWALGDDCLAPSNMAEGPLPIWRTPLAWLRNSRRGLVILNDEVARWRLADAGPLLAEDVEHGRSLRERLSLPQPSIVIPAAERAAA